MTIVITKVILGATQDFDKDEKGTDYVCFIALYDGFLTNATQHLECHIEDKRGHLSGITKKYYKS